MNGKLIHTRRSRRSLVITEILLIALAMVWFIPIYYLIVTTLKSPAEATANPLGLPSALMVSNYAYAWEKMQYPRALFNTFTITASAVLLIILLGGLAGYAVARTKTRAGAQPLHGRIAGGDAAELLRGNHAGIDPERGC